MPQPAVIFLSGDLIFAGRVRAACEAADMQFAFAASLPPQSEESDKDEADVHWVILDLATRSGIAQTIVPEVRQRYPAARLIAYAPHVHTARLAAAREAGFDQVMTRGQFDSWLTRIGPS